MNLVSIFGPYTWHVDGLHLKNKGKHVQATDAKSILLIEDDLELSDLLTQVLKREHYLVTTEETGDKGLQAALSGMHYDLVLLDVMLPNLNGFEILKKLRMTHVTPVIMMTAKDRPIERVLGLELGADDFVPKPFDIKELLARIKAIMRRLEYGANTGAQRQLINGPFRLDNNLACAYYDEQPLPLTGTEFAILQLLMIHQGNTVAKSQICPAVFGRQLQAYDRAIDMHVSNLRKKIGAVSPSETIRTVRGNGYCMASL